MPPRKSQKQLEIQISLTVIGSESNRVTIPCQEEKPVITLMRDNTRFVTAA
jgi:hypothetical protein